MFMGIERARRGAVDVVGGERVRRGRRAEDIGMRLDILIDKG